MRRGWHLPSCCIVRSDVLLLFVALNQAAVTVAADLPPVAPFQLPDVVSMRDVDAAGLRSRLIGKSEKPPVLLLFASAPDAVILGLRVSATGVYDHCQIRRARAAGGWGGTRIIGGGQFDFGTGERIAELVVGLPEGVTPFAKPPAERQLVAWLRIGEEWQQRTYDRSDLPEGLIRLTAEARMADRLGSFVEILRPEQQVPFDRHGQEFPAAVTPEGDGFLWVDGGRGVVLRGFIRGGRTQRFPELQTPSCQYAGFSPDGRLLVVDSPSFGLTILNRETGAIRSVAVTDSHFWRTDHRFDPQGGWLAWRAGGVRGGIHFVDTENWGPMARPNWLPEEAVEFVQSPDGRRAVVERGQEVLLVDCEEAVSMAVLAKGDRVMTAAFSPDGRRVAVSLQSPDDAAGPRFTVGVWDATNGEFERSLLPYRYAWQSPCTTIYWLDSSDRLITGASYRKSLFSEHRYHTWSLPDGAHFADLTTYARGPATPFLSGPDRLLSVLVR